MMYKKHSEGRVKVDFTWQKAVLTAAFIFFASITVVNSANAETIDGNSVYVDTPRVYFSAEPHTIKTGDDMINFELMSKQFSGDIDIAFGFDTEIIKPKTAEIYRNGEWNDVTSAFNRINYDYGGMNSWYYTENVNVNSGQLYDFRVAFNILSQGSGKYWVCVKPSSQTLSQAIASDNFLCLDPWFNVSWLFRQAINITNNNATYVLPTKYSISVDFNHSAAVEAGNSRSDGDDVIVVFENVSGEFEIARYNSTDFNQSDTNLWFALQENISAGAIENDSYFIYYGNLNFTTPNDNAKEVFIFFDDFENLTSGTDVQLSGQGGWVGGSKFTVISGSPCINNGQCVNFTGDGTSTFERSINNTYIEIDNFHTTFWLRGKENGGGNYMPTVFLQENDTDLSGVTGSLIRFSPSVVYTLDYATDIGSSPDNTWQKFVLRVPPLNQSGTYSYSTGAESFLGQGLKSQMVNGINTIELYIDYTNDAVKDQYFDDMIIRMFISPEPTTILEQVESRINTSILAVPFDIQDFTFSSLDFTPGILIEFNTSAANTDFIMLSSMNVEKTSGGGTNIVSARVILDGTIIDTEELRTVTGTGTVGATGLNPLNLSVSPGEHNITVEFARTGTGAILIDNIDLNLIEMVSDIGNSIRNQFVNVSYTHSSTSFVDAFNWTIPKTINSSTYITVKQSVTKGTSGLSDLTYRFFNFAENDFSTEWLRSLSDATDIGSAAGVYIDPNELGTHNHSIQSKQTDVGDTVSVNGSLIDFDLADSAGTFVSFFQETNETTNSSSPFSFSAGTYTLVSSTITLQSGDSYFISATTSFKSGSGAQTPTYTIDSDTSPCISTKDRTLSNNVDTANVFIYTVCENLTVGETYTFNLKLTVPTGETLIQIDENFNGFEAKSFPINIGNLPPIPNEITNPTNGSTVFGPDTITWGAFVDPNEETVTYNVSLYNMDGSFNRTLGDSILITSLAINWNNIVDGNYSLVVEGCDPTPLCSNSSNSIQVLIPPPEIPRDASFCSDDETFYTREVTIETTFVSGVEITNVTIDERFLMCDNGCSNVTFSTFGNPGCIESDFIQALLIISIVILIVIFIRILDRRG